MAGDLQALFQSEDRQRDKFLSRLFGIFSEDLVRCWCKDDRSDYSDLGRPTVRRQGKEPHYTLDFALQSRKQGKVYLGELKCELEFERYKFLTLHSPDQLKHHKKNAFQYLIDAARHPTRYTVTVRGRPQAISGSILVWGRCTDQGRKSVIDEHGFHAVLSLESMIANLVTWRNKEFAALLDKYESWADWLFTGMRGLQTGR